MDNRNFAVGLFVFLGLVVFISTTIWLSGKQGSQPTVNYSMYFEKDVGGLMLGGPVFYLGVEVGTVTAMEIVPGNPMRVRVDARVLKSAPVNNGTYAGLAFQGITGVAVIKLKAESGEHEPLQKLKSERYPVIEVRDTGISALLAKAPNIVDRLDEVLVQVNQIMGAENRRFVGEMLEDFSSVSHALAAKEDVIGELPVLLKTTIEELHANLEQIKSMTGELEPGLKATVENMEQATRNLANLTAKLESWASENGSDLNAFIEDGLGEVPSLVADARATLREVEKLMRDLRENPSKLLYKPKDDAVDVEQ